MGLRLRLNVSLSIIFVATLAIGTALLLNILRHGVAEELGASVEQSARLISVVVDQLAAELDDSALEEVISHIATASSSRHLRVSSDPTTGFDTNHTALKAPRWFYNLVAPEPRGLEKTLPLGEYQRQLYIRADATAEINEAWREAYPLMMMLVLFGLFANGLIYILVGRSLRSLDDISEALRGIGAGDYSTHVPAVGISDIDQIGQHVRDLSVELQRSHAEAQSLARRSLTIQEQERRQLAQALHDELGQSISAVKALGVSILQRHRDDVTLETSIKSIVEVSGAMYEQVRDMMSLLRPTVLDELGLRLALENMVDDWNSHYEETFCRLDIPEDLPDLAEGVAINIFRIVQEALTNIARHARASEAKIELAQTYNHGDRSIILKIDDNGCGFDINAVDKGLGIYGIEERVDAMQGKLMVTSGTAGTRYEIMIPIPVLQTPMPEGQAGHGALDGR